MSDAVNDMRLKIIYSDRKTISIELRLDSILIRAPKGMSYREINSFLKYESFS